MEHVLVINALSKRYGSVQALDKLSLKIPKGSVFGILGPNGSGKTTTLSIILGVVHATSGSFTWSFGFDSNDESRKRIGSLLEKPNFLPYLNAVDNLKMVAEIKEVNYDRIEESLKKTGLYERRKSRFKTYSLGMKQRLAMASVLLSDPEVLVLDEPTNGLDPQGIIEIRELIKELAGRGKTIFLASHMLDEVEKVCTHVAILKNGVLRQEYEIGSDTGAMVNIELAADDMSALAEFLKTKPEILDVKLENNVYKAQAMSDFDLSTLNKELLEAGIALSHFKKEKPSLETAFLNATGGKA
jgi:ABC-2 type transport system ATP-binding protein